jgi:hypothetical protein
MNMVSNTGLSEALVSHTSEQRVALVQALQSADTQDFTRILQGLLDVTVEKIHMRVGLVPNYFMTRGEAETNQFGSFKVFGRKVAEKTFKVFHQKDFREEHVYTEFEQIMETVRDATTRQNITFSNAVADVLNRQSYQEGCSLLQILVKRRHLRFVRTLLLYVSDLLDLDQRDSKGFSALDMASDRLEVEMAFLLLLHGAASTPRTNERTSLGYSEWLGYDMFVNLDTGRWLHKQSEQAILEHAQVSITPELAESLLQWTKGGVMTQENLAQLGRMPRLFAIVLADGCDAITNHEAWASMIRHLSFLRDIRHLQVESSGDTSDDKASSRTEATPCSDLYDFLKNLQVDTSNFRTAGRTVFFTCHDGTEIAVKFSKSLEDDNVPHPLAKEGTMNDKIAHLKQKYGLLSVYPVTVDMLRLSRVPKEIRKAIEGQQAKGFHPFTVTADADDPTVLVYRSPKDYSLYCNDPSLSKDQCLSGIDRAGYDAAVLARYGLYHGTLIDIQHDSSREQRPHLWSFESFLTRFRSGAGRIEKGFAGLGAPNVRVSGLADLKHIITQDQVRLRYDPSVIHAQHNILYNDQERFQVELIEQLGASLFATALLVAASWHSRYVQGVEENLDLEQELENCFSTFLCGYLQIEKEVAAKFMRTIGTDFGLMAAQIKMFATNQYVAIAETAPRRPLFGFTSKILGICHPTAFVHFAQCGSLDLSSKPGRSLPEIKECFGTNVRVDTSMMRCSPTWVRGKGWVNKQGQAHFGSDEGVLPFQQLVRDLYAVVLLAWLVRKHGDGAFELFA